MCVRAAVLSEQGARRVAGRIVAPVDADWNKIALFAATGEREAGLADAVAEALAYTVEQGLTDRVELERLHWYLTNPAFA